MYIESVPNRSSPPAVQKIWERQRKSLQQEKASSKKTADGQIAHSFKSLLNSFSTIVLNVCRFPAEAKKQTFTMTTTPSLNQQKALDLLKNIKLQPVAFF